MTILGWFVLTMGISVVLFVAFLLTNARTRCPKCGRLPLATVDEGRRYICANGHIWTRRRINR